MKCQCKNISVCVAIRWIHKNKLNMCLWTYETNVIQERFNTRNNVRNLWLNQLRQNWYMICELETVLNKQQILHWKYLCGIHCTCYSFRDSVCWEDCQICSIKWCFAIYILITYMKWIVVIVNHFEGNNKKCANLPALPNDEFAQTRLEALYQSLFNLM